MLGIETSCDDTTAAVVQRMDDGTYRILSNEVWAQHDDHRAYGGVVPEIAARSHVERLDSIILKAMAKADRNFKDLDGVAVTAGPGLIGGVVVGLTTAKAIALTHGLPLIPVNHLEGHALSVRLTEKADFPYLLLLVSGGHTQLIKVDALGQYQRLGTTIDDAAGEAFDKTAKLLGIGQPGGPMIEEKAKLGNLGRFSFTSPLKHRKDCDFSFSGLKTALRLEAEALTSPTKQDVADLCAGFQEAAATHLSLRTQNAMDLLSKDASQKTPSRLVVAGGVAANLAIRQKLEKLCHSQGWEMVVPPTKYCTDNGAMIALAGLERLAAGLAPPQDEAMAMAPRARWPLAPPPLGGAFGGGKKGPKA